MAVTSPEGMYNGMLIQVQTFLQKDEIRYSQM